MPARSFHIRRVSAGVFAGVALAAVLAHVVAPETARAAGLDAWGFEADATEYRQAMVEGDALDAAHDLMARQVEASEQVCGLLASNGMSLATAVDELETINEGRYGFEEALRNAFPDQPTPRVRLARFAIRRVGTYPDVPATRLTQLEEEFARFGGAVLHQ